MTPRLVAISSPYTGKIWAVSDAGLKVGRAADNDVCIPDWLVSRHHFHIEFFDGGFWLCDGDTLNGTWVFDQACSRKRLQHGDRIKCGSATFLYLELESSDDDLAVITRAETQRIYQYPTPRADHSGETDVAVARDGALKVLFEMVRALHAIEDHGELQARLLDLSFQMIPALRGAILLNGPRTGPDLDDFVSAIYRERSLDGPAKFPLSSSVLQEIYKEGRALISNNITPVVCAPLMVSGRQRGVVYLEGHNGNDGKGGFEPEHRRYLEGIAELAVAAIAKSKRDESIRDERDTFRELHADDEIVGESDEIQNVKALIRAAAEEDVTVLITGETGVGKEKVARAIHQLSRRANNLMVAVNCGAIVDTLLASELFGVAKGAFTGAVARPGRLRRADNGTIFLDEIGEMTPEMQTRLLRVLQERTFEPVGSEESVSADVRVIAATNVDLKEAIQQKRFRADLYHRLNVLEIPVPPLRQRTGDIPLLAAHFLKKFGVPRGVSGIEPDAMEALIAYPWPGNIRELENVIVSAVIQAKPGTVRVEHIRAKLAGKVSAVPEANCDLKRKGREAAKETVRAALQHRMAENGGDLQEAARYHKIARSWAYELVKQAS